MRQFFALLVQRLPWASAGIFLMLAVWRSVQCAWTGKPAGEWNLTDAILISAAVLATLAGQLPRLPAQNIVVVAAILWLGGAVLEFGLGNLGSSKSGPEMELWPSVWTAALVWMIGLLNARGFSRWLLSRSRVETGHGIWILGCSGLLGAVTVWVWAGIMEPSSTTGWALAKLGIRVLAGWGLLLLSTPFLISKRPVAAATNAENSVNWLALNVLLLTFAVATGASGRAGALIGVNALAGMAAYWTKRKFRPGEVAQRMLVFF